MQTGSSERVASEPSALSRRLALLVVGQSYADSTESCRRAVPYVWLEKTSAAQCTALPAKFLENPCDRRHPDDGWWIELLTKPGTDRLECSGVRTRPVCQLP
jgi:hypothetical protein